jgi:hypothetical protein
MSGSQMAKAGRKSTTARKRKRKHRKSEHKAAPKAEPERTFFTEKLGGRPPPPFVIRSEQPTTVSVEQWAEMRKRAAECQRGLRSIDRTTAIRDRLIPPPWMERRRKERPQIRLAKELIAATYSGGEWRTMRTVNIRHGCAPAAEARGVRLPSTDSFSRALGRRE